MTATKLREHYKHKASYWIEQINKINSLPEKALLLLEPFEDPFYTRNYYIDNLIDLAYEELVQYIALLNGGIIFNDKEED